VEALEKRGTDNRRKRIYMSAVTPDLYRSMYSEKVTQFFARLLDAKNAGKPLMRPMLASPSSGLDIDVALVSSSLINVFEGFSA
jgi:hypothetical protein